MNKKRILSFIFTLGLILVALYIPVFAEENAIGEIYSGETINAEAGEEVIVPVSIRNNPGIMGYLLKLTYDQNFLTPISVERGGVLTEGNFEDDIDGNTKEEGVLKVVWNHSAEIANDGLLFNVRFNINESATGTSIVKLSCIDYQTYNASMVTPELEFANAVVSVEHVHEYGEWVVTKEATCSEEGLMVRTCSICQNQESQMILIDPDKHVPGEVVIENEIEATLESEGSYDEVVYCMLCNTELSRKTVIVPKLVDRSNLYALITEAISEVSGTKISVDGEDVPKDVKWVDQSTSDTLSSMIHSALDLYSDTEATQEEVDAAAEELDVAIQQFFDAKQDGKMGETPEEPVSTAALLHIISSAISESAQVAVSTDGSDVDRTAFWVTQEEKNALINVLNNAIELAGNSNATQAEIDAAKDTVAEALGVFNNAKKAGGKQIDLARFEAGWITLEYEETDYLGTAIEPEVTILYDGTVLKKDIDYDVTYESNKNAGMAIVTITGAGEYTGIVTRSFRIKPAVLTEMQIDPVSVEYSGLEQKVAISVSALLGGEKVSDLTEGMDYEVTYENNILPGTARVTVTGIGNYTGALVKEFDIVAAEDVPVESISLSMTSAEVATSETLQLSVDFLPVNTTDRDITWSSDNESIVTVDENGLVKAVKYGKAVITATASNGAKATCQIQTRFRDVNDPDKEYYPAVYWAVDKGITRCTDKFNPESDVKRGEFVAFVYRVAGYPKNIKLVTKFKDVNSTTKFYKEISWAINKGIIKGFSDGTFRPNDGVTRGQTAIMLWRFAGRPSVSTSSSPFSDVKAAKSDTCQAILWCNKNGIITGFDGEFRPNVKCTRADIVTFLYRYKQKF